MVLNYYYYFLLGALAAQTIRMHAPAFHWSFIREMHLGETNEVGSGKTGNNPGHRWLVQPGFSHTLHFWQRVAAQVEALMQVSWPPLGLGPCYNLL